MDHDLEILKGSGGPLDDDLTIDEWYEIQEEKARHDFERWEDQQWD